MNHDGLTIIPWRLAVLRAALVLFSFLLVSSPNLSQGQSLTVLSDEELDAIEGQGFYFLMDLTLEVFTESNNPPQVVVNTGTPLIIPTSGTAGFSGPLGGSISLSGNAQSNMSSLINVIGATSVINVGLNIISITNSTNDTIISTNINTGAMGSGFDIIVPLFP